MESGYRPSELCKRSAKAHKKKKNSNKKKKEGGINELAIILQNILNSSFPGRDVWCVGGWVCGGFGTTLTLARSWARKRAKFHESSALKGISVWCTMFYPPCPLPPPSTVTLFCHMQSLTQTQSKQSAPLAAWPWGHMSSALPPPHPSAPLTMLDKCNCSPVFYLLGNFDWSINLKAFRLFRHKYFAYDKLGDWERYD